MVSQLRAHALLTLCLWLNPWLAYAECHARVSVTPENPFVGEAVLYRVQILMPAGENRVEWTRSPAFPHVRTERLPGEPQRESALAHDQSHAVHEERRMLFAERAGRIVLESPDLLCHNASGTQLVSVPKTQLSARDTPTAGRPENDSGLVGSVQLQLTVTPETLSLGETLRVAVRVVGGGSVWNASDPFATADWDGADVFARPKEVVIDRGRELITRVHFVADIVPRSAGSFPVPSLQVPYFDPDSGRYTMATTEPVSVQVGPRVASVTQEAEVVVRPALARVHQNEVPTAASGRSWVLGGMALVMLGGLAWRFRSRGSDAPARALRALGELGTEANAESLARIVRQAIGDAVPHASSATPEELAALPGLGAEVQEAIELLRSLTRARFDPSAPSVNSEEVRRALERL